MTSSPDRGPGRYRPNPHLAPLADDSGGDIDRGAERGHHIPPDPALTDEGGRPCPAGASCTGAAFPGHPPHPPAGEFCHRHFSWKCGYGQGQCQRGAE